MQHLGGGLAPPWLASYIYGDVIKILAELRYCELGLNCHMTYMTLVVLNKRYTSVNVVSLSHYKCFFEPFSSPEASSLVSSSLAVGRGKPLNENRSEVRGGFTPTESPNNAV